MYCLLAAWLIAEHRVAAAERERALNGLLRTIGNALLAEVPWRLAHVTDQMRAP